MYIISVSKFNFKMVIMKKIKYLFAGILLIIGFGGCMDDFIEKPSVTGLTVEEVFSSAKTSRELSH